MHPRKVLRLQWRKSGSWQPNQVWMVDLFILVALSYFSALLISWCGCCSISFIHSICSSYSAGTDVALCTTLWTDEHNDLPGNMLCNRIIDGNNVEACWSALVSISSPSLYSNLFLLSWFAGYEYKSNRNSNKANFGRSKPDWLFPDMGICNGRHHMHCHSVELSKQGQYLLHGWGSV